MAPNWLGDIVMMSPLLALLAGAKFGPDEQAPRLILAVRQQWIELFRGDSRFAEILPLARDGKHKGLKGLPQLVKDLAHYRPDAVILGPPSLRVGLAAALARIPLRVGFRTDCRGLLLNGGQSFPGRGPSHYSDQFLALGRKTVSKFGGKILPPDTSGNLLPGFEIAPLADSVAGPPLWVMGVGTTYGEAKVWPRRNVLAFLKIAVEKFGVRVVLLGEGPRYGAPPYTRGELSPWWREEIAGGAGVVDLVGQTTLAQVGAILGAAQAFVGNDSGLMHLAGAMAIPTVGIFGSSNPAWTSPLGERSLAVGVEGFACSPCFRSRCNQSQFCLDSLTAQKVLTALLTLLERDTEKTGVPK